MNKQTFPIPPNCKSITQELDLENNRIITTFEPEFKVGDMVESLGDIHIISKIENDSLFFDVILHAQRNDIDLHYNDWGITKNFRHAADSEIKLLFDALTKEGKKWNAEKCCIEDLKVVPKVGDCVKLSRKNNELCILAVISEVVDGYYKYKSRIIGDIVYNEDGVWIISNDTIFEILSKDQFQKELSDLGFEYNFEDDTFSELKWKPKDGEACFLIDVNGNFIVNNIIYSENSWTERAFNSGRIFKTFPECEEVITKIKNILK